MAKTARPQKQDVCPTMRTVGKVVRTQLHSRMGTKTAQVPRCRRRGDQGVLAQMARERFHKLASTLSMCPKRQSNVTAPYQAKSAMQSKLSLHRRTIPTPRNRRENAAELQRALATPRRWSMVAENCPGCCSGCPAHKQNCLPFWVTCDQKCKNAK